MAVRARPGRGRRGRGRPRWKRVAAGEGGLDEEVHQEYQHDAGEQEQPAVEQGEAHPQPRWSHGIRYPAPGTVSIGGGSPSLRRSVMMVTRTTWVNGSMFSSHAFSSSCSADTTAPSARSSS